MLYSPINYQGNKSRIVDKLNLLIPKDCDCIYEIFCGSAILSLNSNIKNIVLNDIDINILNLLKYFKDHTPETIINNSDKIIKEYRLTNSYYEGKNNYIELKHEGLSRYNKDPYLKLRNDYNKDHDIKKLFVLIIYGFNHYLRFNKNGDFNVPVGKVDFVESIRKKVFNYCNAIKSKSIKFFNKNFNDPTLYKNLKSSNLLYFDPPYLITLAPYNMFWNEDDEKELLNLLDWLDKNNMKFMLSNVIESNGKSNEILKKWMNKYHVHYIKRQYLNSNYQKKNLTNAIEVVITNY